MVKQGKEEWRDVIGFDGSYRVSSYGRIWSNLTDRILKPYSKPRGETMLILRKNGRSFRRFVHRLVAQAFIMNPNKYPEVNHKDENPRNNHVDNLEWCTHQYNNTYGTKIERALAKTDYEEIARKNSKKVAQYDLNGKLIRIWDSAREVMRVTGIDNSWVGKCCKGQCKSVGGFVWRHLDKQSHSVNLGA